VSMLTTDFDDGLNGLKMVKVPMSNRTNHSSSVQSVVKIRCQHLAIDIEKYLCYTNRDCSIFPINRSCSRMVKPSGPVGDGYRWVAGSLFDELFSALIQQPKLYCGVNTSRNLGVFFCPYIVKQPAYSLLNGKEVCQEVSFGIGRLRTWIEFQHPSERFRQQ
jgi:hypothetical protein